MGTFKLNRVTPETASTPEAAAPAIDIESSEGSSAPETTTPATPEAPAPAASVPPPRPAHQSAFDDEDDGGSTGGVGGKWLKLVQPTSPATITAKPEKGGLGASVGEFVYDASLVLGDKVKAVLVGIGRRKYQKWVKFDPANKTKQPVVDTPAEVTAQGGTIMKKGSNADRTNPGTTPYWEELCSAMFLIERTNDKLSEEAFPFVLDGKQYILAKVLFKSSSLYALRKIEEEKRPGNRLMHGISSKFIELGSQPIPTTPAYSITAQVLPSSTGPEVRRAVNEIRQGAGAKPVSTVAPAIAAPAATPALAAGTEAKS